MLDQVSRTWILIFNNFLVNLIKILIFKFYRIYLWDKYVIKNSFSKIFGNIYFKFIKESAINLVLKQAVCIL